MNTNINNIKFQREKDINNNYLIVKNVQIDKEAYEYKILEEEKIVGTLEYRVDREEGKTILKYDIGGMVSLDDYLKVNRLKKKDIIFIVESVKELLCTIENFLISENSILLDPRSIFLLKNNDKMEIKYCLIPCLIADFSYELSKFLIRLLRHVDTTEKDALELAYALFLKSSIKNYSISDLMNVIDEKRNSKIETEKIDETSLKMYENMYEDIKNIDNDYSQKIEDIDYNDILNNEPSYENGEDVIIDDKTKEALGIKIFSEIDNKELNETNKKVEVRKSERVSKPFMNLSNLPIKLKLSYIVLPILAVMVPILAFFVLGNEFFRSHILLLIVYEVLISLIISLNSLMDAIFTEN